MRQRILNALNYLLIACCSLVSLLWIDSYHHRTITFNTVDAKLSLAFSRGQARFLYESWMALSPNEKPGPDPKFWGSFVFPRLGIEGGVNPRVKDPDHFKGIYAALIVPFRILFLGVFLPLLICMRLTRRLSIAPNHCRNCNYDLRATPERCPECGTIP